MNDKIPILTLSKDIINHICSFLEYIDIFCWKLSTKYVYDNVNEYYSANNFIKRYLSGHRLLWQSDKDGSFVYGYGLIMILLNKSIPMDDIYISEDIVNFHSQIDDTKKLIIDTVNTLFKQNGLDEIIEGHLYSDPYHYSGVNCRGCKLTLVDIDKPARHIINNVLTKRHPFALY